MKTNVLFAKYQLDPQALQQRLFKIAELNKNTCKWSLKPIKIRIKKTDVC